MQTEEQKFVTKALTKMFKMVRRTYTPDSVAHPEWYYNSWTMTQRGQFSGTAGAPRGKHLPHDDGKGPVKPTGIGPQELSDWIDQTGFTTILQAQGFVVNL